ncbi:MAG: hydroxyacylglutathione hydrolase [Pseudomonadota bacterium]
MSLEIRQFPCLSDNYGFLLHDATTGACAAVDTPDAEAIDAELAKAGWRLTHILNTHHHYDHAGGNLALKDKWGCEIVGPKGEADKIPGLDRAVGEGDLVTLGASEAHVVDTPGHTAGHVVYYFPKARAAFVGDTIFAMGCGRLFEGTASDMSASLAKIAAWPDDTTLYCAHEYTEANGRFALTVDPDNPVLKARMEEVLSARAAGRPTVPTRLDIEKDTNPFLRAADAGVRTALGMQGAGNLDVFAEIRHRKDRF